MSDPSDVLEGEKTSIGGELILPAVGFVFTLYYFVTIWESPWTAQVSAFGIGSVLLLLIFILFVRAMRGRLAGRVDFGFAAVAAPRRLLRTPLLLFILTIAYIGFVDWLGFTITSFLFLFLAMFLLGGGRNPRMAAGLSVTLALLGYTLFIFAFETRFPDGPFEALIKGLM